MPPGCRTGSRWSPGFVALVVGLRATPSGAAPRTCRRGSLAGLVVKAVGD